MAQTKKDSNNVDTMTGVLNTDGTTPINITINPTTHILDASDGSSGSDFGNDWAARDNNSVPVLMAVSNADGITPVMLYVNSSGQLMVKST